MDGNNTKPFNPQENDMKVIREMQKLEVLSGKVYESLSPRVSDPALLLSAAELKQQRAGLISRLSGEEFTAPAPKVLYWKMIAKVFGPAFVISRMEARAAETGTYFEAACASFPESAELARMDEEIRQKTSVLLGREGLHGFGAVITSMYSSVILLLTLLTSFAFNFKGVNLTKSAGVAAGCALLCAAAASAAAAEKAFPKKRRRCLRAALVTILAMALLEALLLAPLFRMASLWPAIGVSALLGTALLTLLACFMAVIRREDYLPVLLDMIVTCLVTVGGAQALLWALNRFVFHFHG